MIKTYTTLTWYFGILVSLYDFVDIINVIVTPSTLVETQHPVC